MTVGPLTGPDPSAFSNSKKSETQSRKQLVAVSPLLHKPSPQNDATPTYMMIKVVEELIEVVSVPVAQTESGVARKLYVPNPP